MRKVGAVDFAHVERVRRRMPQFAKYFFAVEPIAFLDDTTTRNVIVHDGDLSGIVDVDESVVRTDVTAFDRRGIWGSVAETAA